MARKRTIKRVEATVISVAFKQHQENRQRAERVRPMVEQYMKILCMPDPTTEEDLEAGIADMITDLLHLGDSIDYDPLPTAIENSGYEKMYPE